MDGFDRLRRSALMRGRVAVPTVVSTRQRIGAELLSGMRQAGRLQSSEEMTDADGHPVFVFGLCPMVDPYVVR